LIAARIQVRRRAHSSSSSSDAVIAAAASWVAMIAMIAMIAAAVAGVLLVELGDRRADVGHGTARARRGPRARRGLHHLAADPPTVLATRR